MKIKFSPHLPNIWSSILKYLFVRQLFRAYKLHNSTYSRWTKVLRITLTLIRVVSEGMDLVMYIYELGWIVLAGHGRHPTEMPPPQPILRRLRALNIDDSWLEDGNSIFRVYTGILTARSTVFEICSHFHSYKRRSLWKLMDGCPLVQTTWLRGRRREVSQDL